MVISGAMKRPALYGLIIRPKRPVMRGRITLTRERLIRGQGKGL